MTLTLDRPVTGEWVSALINMGSHTAVMGKGPGSFTFKGNIASVQAADYQVQDIINHFKDWLPRASQKLKYELERALAKKDMQHKEYLRIEREAEERRSRLLQNIKL